MVQSNSSTQQQQHIWPTGRRTHKEGGRVMVQVLGFSCGPVLYPVLGFFWGVEVFVLVYACVVADLLCLFCCLFVFFKKVENAFPSVSYDKFF